MTPALLKRLKALEDKYILDAARQYTLSRDNQHNLVSTFGNGKIIRLPFGFDFRHYQLSVQEAFVRGIKQFFLVWPRRHGKEVMAWNLLLSSAIETPGDYVIIYPTYKLAKNVIWNGGITLPNGDLLKFKDMLPKEFMKGRPNEADLIIKLVNGSNIYVRGSQDSDSLRGTNYRGIVISEFAYCDPEIYRALQPILAQNNGWIMLQTTFNGMNHAYQLLNLVKDDEDWYARVESVETLRDENGNSYITEETIERDRRSGMPEYKIQQEYYSVVSRNEESMYFASTMNLIESEGKITLNVLIPGQPVHLALDIGVNDATGLTFFQLDRDYKPRIVNYYESKGKNVLPYLEHYLSWVNKRQLAPGTVVFPHDGRNRTFRVSIPLEDTCAQLGIKNYLFTNAPTSEYAAIQLMREYLYQCLFEESTTRRLRECISNYSKEWDDKRGIYREKPRHDWASHGTKSYQTMVLAVAGKLISSQSMDVVYYNK